LHFFAAERTAHTQALHGDLMPGQAQNTCDHILRFGGMLRGGIDQDAACFIEPGDGALCFQIEVLLAAYIELAGEPKSAAVKRGYVSPIDMQGTGVKTGGGNGLLDCHNRGERFILGPDKGGTQTRGLQGVSQNPGDGLLVIHDFVWEKRLVMPIAAGLIFTGHIGRGQDALNAR